jgi:endonuclease/exonuclease/phosphatase family metal-dependent hydrolase
MIEHAPSEIYRNNLPRQFGNILLSKYRITQAQRHMLPWPAAPEHPSGMPRGMIETVLDAPGGKLRLLTTHLEYYSPLQRRAQVRRIRELHAEACARAAIYQPEPDLEPPFQLGFRPGTGIYCGDFNFTPGFRRLPRAAGAAAAARWPWSMPGRVRHGDMARAPTAGLHGYQMAREARTATTIFS